MRWFVLVAVAIGACTSGEPDSTAAPPLEPIRGTATAEAAVERLRAALASGDDVLAAALTEPDQLVLVALSEGASPTEVAELGPDELSGVGANFWAGFRERFALAAGVEAGDLVPGDLVTRDVDGVAFASVDLVLRADGSSREIVVKETDAGWVIDVVASFPSPLLLAIPEAFEAATRAAESGLVETLRRLEPSARFVLTAPDVGPELEQAALAALAAIEG